MKRILKRKVKKQWAVRHLVLSFLLLVHIHLVTAQPPLQNLYLNNEIKFERLGMEHGLNNIVNGMMQDKKGYMWFATMDGLYKYDAYTLTHYQHNPRDTNSLADNIVMSLYEDNKGLIWMGFGAGGGVNSFNPQTGEWKRYAHDPKNPSSLTSSPIHTIQQDHGGRLWFGSLNAGISCYDPQTAIFKHYKNNPADEKSISSDRVPVLFVDKAGQVWAGTNQGLDIYDPKTESFQHIRGHYSREIASGKPDAKRNVFPQPIIGSITDSITLTQSEVHSIIQDNKGLLWLSTLGKGVFILDPVTKRFKVHLSHNPALPGSLSDNYVVCLTQDKAGDYWMSTASGVTKLDAKTGLFTVYQQAHYLPERPWNVHSVLTDKGGVVWLGSMAKGALYFTPAPRKFYRYLDSSDDRFGDGINEVHHIFKSSDGQLYITTNHSLLRFHPIKKEFSLVYQSKKEKGQQEPTAFFTSCEEKPGVFWIGTWGKGIIRYDATTKKETFLQHNPRDSGSVAHNVVNALLRDRQGVIWAGTQDGHLQRYDASQRKFIYHRFRTEEQRTQFTEEGFRFLFQDKAGNLWVALRAGFSGTGGSGLFRINMERGTTVYYSDKAAAGKRLSSNVVTSIYEDKQGILWLGTHGGGLNRLDPVTGIITFYTKENGLQSNKIDGLMGDKNGNIWISSSKGITFFNPVTSKTDWFDVADGLGGTTTGQLIVGTFGEYAAFEDEDGTIYFGSDNGFTVFHPDRIYVNRAKPPVVIDRFKVFDKVVPVNERGIVLSYNQNFFDFEFTALNYVSSGRNQYAYKLEGVDKDWVYSGTRRIARYTDVRPGNYTFRVKGANNDGIWNEQGIAIPVTVRPPWWLTWWAYALYAILIIGSIWAFIHYRSRNLLRQKRELEKEVASRTAEVVHQKEELQVTLENLKATQTQLIQKEKMASLGELTAGIAHEIQNPLNFVNNFSEMNTELVDDAQAELKVGNTQETLVILGNIKANEQKIAHHGRRAEAIVKSMLQHSRTSAGEKQATDINALTDEYLRLSYRGLRAKDNSFNAVVETDFDETLNHVDVVPQDIGRVLLNLFNNAFYAVSEKKKKYNGTYEPVVSVVTKRVNEKIEIQIKDNGTGIPGKAVDKIFQPFFTTKPTGEGTGLGLSLSYDIITKGHGGELKIETEEGKYAKFIIQLPLKDRQNPGV